MLGGHSRRPGTRAGQAGPFVSFAAVGCGIAVLTAGCGLIGSPTAATSGSSSSSSSSGASGSSSPSRSAYLNCLRQHGVNIPTARPTPGSGGFAGGSGGGFAGGSAFTQARQACASLRPSGGFGGGFGGGEFASAIQAFRSCMSSHGVTIPTTRPTAPPTSAPSASDRFLNGLDPGNPKVAAALSACRPKLPSFQSGG